MGPLPNLKINLDIETQSQDILSQMTIERQPTTASIV
ncbi:hypothetical protein [Vibrio phage 2 TSL-2019]|uniref:Uncharacterized protein n=1 Tax=Vibrio phage 2 TSL-2019 TaxID=2508172 RepID=A0A513PW89_9CAUD|nr:hypothetical protein HWC03_gp023 [Vibrio phage 2 TSL-2019]QAU04178.1 hypothetical protein [Vibrio phage 2 TSL-2019]